MYGRGIVLMPRRSVAAKLRGTTELLNIMSSRSSRNLTERGMQIAEQRIPHLAAKAGRDAYWAALKQTGAVTVKTSSGQVVERKSDGSVTVIKDLPVGKRVKLGTVLRRVK